MIKTTIKMSVLPLALVSAQAGAAMISYYLDQSNVLPGGVNYAQVTISDSTTTTGDIDFSVAVIASSFDLSDATNFGMQTFSFNYDTALTVNASNIININPVSWSISQDVNAGGGFGKFEFQLSGTGNSRTELLNFSISNVAGDSINDYAISSILKPSSDEFFAAHIAGYGVNGGDSAQFAGSSPVPVPAAVWLFGSGLIGLVGVARRKCA